MIVALERIDTDMGTRGEDHGLFDDVDFLEEIQISGGEA